MSALRLFRSFLSTATTSSSTRHFRKFCTSPERSAVVLLSGGLDSATVLAIALSEGYRVTTLSFDYGQRHRHELEAAKFLSSKLGVQDHRVATVDPSIFRNATSLLNNSPIPVPKSRDISTISPPTTTMTTTSSSLSSPPSAKSIPSTYVPARNTLFLSYALALAESLPASDIFIGANAIDYSGYPDCRPEFFRAFQQVADIGTRAGVQCSSAPVVRVPLLHSSKKDIIRTGLNLGVDYALTHSCYDPGPDGKPCTACDACILRADAFAQLGFAVDPVVERYQHERTAMTSERDGSSSGAWERNHRHRHTKTRKNVSKPSVESILSEGKNVSSAPGGNDRVKRPPP